MEIVLTRVLSTDEESIGLLDVDRKFECFSLEDEFRTHKVMHETRIPAGIYDIKLREAGRIHEKYAIRFKGMHKGVLHLQDVPGFTYIYIHCGNTDDHTSGCILVGNQISKRSDLQGGSELAVLHSTTAYTNLYKKCIEAFERKENVSIRVIDEDHRYIIGTDR